MPTNCLSLCLLVLVVSGRTVTISSAAFSPAAVWGFPLGAEAAGTVMGLPFGAT